MTVATFGTGGKGNMMTQSTRTKTAKQAKRSTVEIGLRDLELIGEIITWNLGPSTIRHADIINGLIAADLDSAVARDLAPRHAFTRAARKMSRDRVIDLIKDDNGRLFFQFTAKALESDEWRFAKEAVIRLDKTNGIIECDNNDLREAVQRALDSATENRTTTDVSNVIGKLFDKQTDLFPIRDHGGAYFVPITQTDFLDRIGKFLAGIGGRLGRFPVPAGIQHATESVRDTVAHAIDGMIGDHRAAVESFDVNTHSRTLETMVSKIETTRTKIEAYANYLSERAADLTASIDDAKKILVAKIAMITKEKTERQKTAPKSETGEKRNKIFGYAVTPILRWMGSRGWTVDDASKAMSELIGPGIVAESTIRSQIKGWQKRLKESDGRMPELTDEQTRELESIRSKGEDLPLIDAAERKAKRTRKAKGKSTVGKFSGKSPNRV